MRWWKSIFILSLVISLTLLNCFLKNPFAPDSKQNKWTAINSDLTDLHIQAMAIDPNQPTTIYGSTYAGVFKSTNGGKSWQLSNSGMTSNDVKILVCMAKDSKTLYAATWGRGVFCSRDGGSSWYQCNNGITDLRILSIRENKNDLDLLYAISELELLKSVDGGKSWQNLSFQFGKIISLAVDFEMNNLFLGTKYNGIYTSSDDGNTWQAAKSGLPKATDGYYHAAGNLELGQDSSQTIWAAISGKGLYSSHDGGKNWHCDSDALNGISINCLAIDPHNSDVIYVGSKQGVFVTRNKSLTWEKINDGLTNLDVQAIAIDPQNPRIIYAGTMGGGIFKMILD